MTVLGEIRVRQRRDPLTASGADVADGEVKIPTWKGFQTSVGIGAGVLSRFLQGNGIGVGDPFNVTFGP